jgi:DNA-binding MarR family transcriptional regulator
MNVITFFDTMADDATIEELVQCVGFRLRKATRQVSQIYDQALQQFDLTGTQFSLLSHLPRGRQLPVGDLAEELGSDSSTLTRNLGLLERRGLVKLVAAPYDRRVRLVLSTKEGQALQKRAVPAWRAARSELERRIGSEAFEQLKQALDRL